MADEALDAMLAAIDRHAQSVCAICGGSLAASTNPFLCSDTCRAEWGTLFMDTLAEAQARKATPPAAEAP